MATNRLAAPAPGVTRALVVRRWPMRADSPNAAVASFNLGVVAIDIAADGAVTELQYSWAGPGSSEVVDRLFDEAAAIGATGIVPNLGAGQMGSFIPLEQLGRDPRTLIDAVPSRPFALGSRPLGAPKDWQRLV